MCREEYVVSAFWDLRVWWVKLLLIGLTDEQVCIPVGCVPPAFCPYISACTAPGGVSAPGGCLLPGVGVSAPGRGCIPACTEADTHLVKRLTDTCKNITLPQLLPAVITTRFGNPSLESYQDVTLWRCIWVQRQSLFHQEGQLISRISYSRDN